MSTDEAVRWRAEHRMTPSPARYGVTTERGPEWLRAAGWWDEQGITLEGEAVLGALSRCADPDMALLSIDRLRTALGPEWHELDHALRHDVDLRGRLFAVLGVSGTLGDFLVANPSCWRRLAERPGLPVDAGRELADALLRAPAGEAVRALRTGYRELLLRIAAVDLGAVVEPSLQQATYEEVAAALSEAAEAALRAALSIAAEETERVADCRLAVIAMGKCGGRELNYVSDVDVLFVAEGDTRVATRLAATTMRVAGAAAFEVDAALRPEGKTGALARTMDAYRDYYRRWARTWEFQALLKARPVAGDGELGAEFVEVVRPLVWSAADTSGFVDDVRSMRMRVERHLPVGIADRELKLGRGGLRDVEFAVQLLQLVHGRGDEELHVAATLDALRVLGERGYVGREDAAGMAESYVFLRTLEHRLQLRRLLRTHLFPAEDDADELGVLARSVGIAPRGERSAGQVLLADFHRHAARIRRLHEKLFYRPLLEAVARVPTERMRLTPRQAESRLAALGYAGPDGALHHIEALTAGVSRRAAIQRALLPVVLDLLAETPDPDAGLLAYRRMSEALSETPWYLRLLRDEGAVVQRLATLLGTSRLVPDLAVRAPEGLRLLADEGELAGRDPADVAASLRSAVRRHATVADAVSAARALRRHELFRVASADLLGLLDVESVCAALSQVWVAVLQSALAAAERAGQDEFSPTPPARLAVIGMGRLGGDELGYGSDADVLLVCEPVSGSQADEAAALRYASGVFQSVRTELGAPTKDPPLSVDVDLRPEGRAGPLVRTLRSYRAYYERWAATWEAQALLRARYVAGDRELADRFLADVDEFRYPAGGLDASREREIKRMKVRVEQERLPRGFDQNTNTKLGPGGLSDVEWTVQLLQLAHAGAEPGLRTTSTLGGLRAAVDAGLLGRDDADALRAAWRSATRARNATVLVRGLSAGSATRKGADQLPTSGRELAAVARIGGTDDPGEFRDEYLRTARRARAVVERIFYDA